MRAAAPTTRLARPTVGDQVAQVVRRRIWDGELRPGDRLNQEELAASLGVSRIPVRDALMGLEREGVVRMEPHRGAFVEPVDGRSVADHFELYAFVDGFAAAKACERATDDQLAELAGVFLRAGGMTDPDSLQKAVVDARGRLHDLGGSPRFRAMARGLSGIVPGNFFAAVEGSAAVARAGLPRVADALVNRDGDAAVAAYQRMMIDQGRLVLADLRRRGVIDDHRPDRAGQSSEQGTR